MATKTLKSSSIGAIAIDTPGPDNRRPNDERVKMYSGMTENMKLMNTTRTGEGGMDAMAYDEMQSHAPSDRSYPVQFETIVDGSGRLPQWQHHGDVSNNPSQATHGAAMPGGTYTKSPTRMEHSVADNANVSKMGSWEHPVSSGINSAGGSIGKSDAGINK